MKMREYRVKGYSAIRDESGRLVDKIPKAKIVCNTFSSACTVADEMVQEGCYDLVEMKCEKRWLRKDGLSCR